jgi:DNA-binding NarL/FixJ family response regulator
MDEIFARDQELAAILGAIRRTPAGGTVQIEGPAGIGKTTVFDAALAALEADGWRILTARPSEAEALMSLLGLHDLLDPIIEETRPRLSERERTDLEAGLGIGPPGQGVDEAGLGLAVLATLRAAAAERPTIVGIDDVQWLDRSSASALGIALRRLREMPLAVLATRRIPGPAPGLQLGRAATLARIGLEPLSVGALQHIVLSRLGRSLPRPTIVRLHEASGGNPLYALEFARAITAEPLRPEALDASVPEDLGDFLWRRTRRLSQTSRDLVALAALAARPSADLAAAVLGVERSIVDDAVVEAAGAGLLHEADGALQLGHPLVGSVVRHRTSSARRRSFHRRLAAEVADEDEAALHHGLAAAGPDEPAAAALEAAARRAFSRGARIDALDRYDRAIRLTPPEHGQSLARRRVGLAEAALVAGDTERALAELDGLDIATLADPDVRSQAAMLFSAAGWLSNRTAEAADLLELLLREPSTPEVARGQMHARLGLLYEGDRRRGLAHYREALDLLDPDAEPSDYAVALLGLAGNQLHLQEAADHEAIRRGGALQLIEDRWDTSTLPLNWPIWMDDWPTARRMVAEERPRADAAGDETSISYLLTLAVEIELWSGQLDPALVAAEQAVEHAESTSQRGRLLSALVLRGLVHALRGGLDLAEVDANRVLEAVEGGRRSTTLLGHALAVLGAVARARDDFAATERHLGRALEALDAAGDIDQPIHRFHADLLDALIARGQVERARALIDRLARSGTLGPRPRLTGIAERGRALVAMAEGRSAASFEHIRAALAAHAVSDAPFERARTLLVAGQLERRAGRRRIAAGHLEAAAELFTTVGASGWADRARRELGRLGLQRGSASELTPSEQRIASLAASGLRNHEIATRLLISPKTVEANLARAYAKLGIRARAELAVALRAVSASPGDTEGSPTT